MARAGLEGPGVLICGPDGSGRSAVARVLATRPALSVRAGPAESERPLFAVRVAIGAAVCPDDPAQAVEVLSEHLARTSRARPVIVVDDVAHLDRESQSVLAALAATGRARLVAVRSSGTNWNELGLARVDLPPLDDDSVHEIIARRLSGPIEHRSALSIIDLSGGRPWLAHQLVDASLSSGALVERDGLWRLDGEVCIPPSVDEHCESLLAVLGPEGRAAAEVLASAGRAPDRIALVAADAEGMEEIERRGLVTSDGDVVGLSSAIVAEHLRRRLGPATRRRLASRLAGAAAAAGGWDTPAGEVATAEWRLDAGLDVDPQVLLDAARSAVGLGDTVRAERLAAASAAASPQTEAVLLQSWCADEQGEGDRAQAILAAHVPVGPDAEVALAVRRAEQRFWVRRDQASARSLLDETRQAVSPPWDLAAAMQLAVFDLLDGDVRRAVDGATPHLAHPEHMVSSNAALAVGLALTLDGRPEDARSVAEDALLRLSGPTPPLYIDPGVHVITLGFALLGDDELTSADGLTASAHAHAIRQPGRQAQGWAALLRARVLLARGRPLHALAVALEAEGLWADARLHGLARWSATVAAQAAAEAADLATLRSCLGRVETYEAEPFRLFDPEVDRARSWLALLEGETLGSDAVSGRLTRAATQAVASGRRHLGMLAAFDLVRMGAVAAGASLLDEIAAGPSSRALERRRNTAAAALRRDAETLERAASEWESLGASGTAAECRAMGAIAAPARAVPTRATVASLVGSGGLDTPVLRSLERIEIDRDLTSREREVVALAAEGLSNREIAERLVVSPRTVENHLHRAFAKLGVRSRSDLRA